MSDWITTIISGLYHVMPIVAPIVVPIVVWLWQTAKLPKVNWDRIAAGILMTFASVFLEALVYVFTPWAEMSWGSAFIALFSFFATISQILGLAIIGFYLLVDALLMWKF